MTDPNSPDAPRPDCPPPPPPPPTEPTPGEAPPTEPLPATPASPPPGEGVPTTKDAVAGSPGTEPTEVMPATPPPPDAVGAEAGAAAGGAVPPGEVPGAPGEADDETPWYKTPLGIAGLVLGGLLLVALLIWIFWGGDDDDGEVVSASVELITQDETGAALDRGFFASVTGTGASAESFVWLQPSEAPGPDDTGGTTGDDGRIVFEWAPAAEVVDPEAWTSTVEFVENAPAGFVPPGPVVDCVLSQPDAQARTISMNVMADPPDTSVDQVVTYTFPNHEFLPGDRVRCELVSGLPPETTTTSTTTTSTTSTTVPETTTTVESTTTVAPTTAAPTTAGPTTVAPTTPPTAPATVTEALTAAGDYGAFLGAAAGFPSVTDLLDGPGPVTVFAPTDEALAAATLPADPDDLEQLLLSHIVDGEALDAAAIFDGTRTEVDVATGGTQPVDQGAGTVGGVVVEAADLTATNGVAHGLDGVMPVAAP